MDNLLYVTGYVLFVVTLLFVLNIFLKIVHINSSKRRLLAALFALLVSLGVQLALPYFPLLGARVHDVVVAVTWLAAALLVTSSVRFFIWEGVLAGHDGYALVPIILRFFINILFWLIFASLYFKVVLDQSVMQLFAATGVVAIVLGYAAQGVLGDIFSGMALAISRNLKRGDGVKLDNGVKGKVVELGWRSAKVLTWTNSVEIVPHSALSKMVITNVSHEHSQIIGHCRVEVSAAISPSVVVPVLNYSAQDASFPLEVRRSECGAVASEIHCKRMAYVSYFGWITLSSGEVIYSIKQSAVMTLFDHKMKKLGYDIASGIYSKDIAEQATPQYSPEALKVGLAKTDILGDLNLDESNSFMAQLSVERFIDKERVIVQHDEEDKDLYVLLSGHCVVYETNEAGDVNKMRDLYGGLPDAQNDVFGIQAALLGEPRRISVRSVGVSDVLHIQRDSLAVLTKHHPDIVDKLASLLASRVQQNQQTHAALFGSKKHTKHSLKEILAERIKNLFSTV